MKKISFFVLFVVMMFLNIRVSALNASELKDKLYQEVTVGGHTYTISDSQKVIVDRYFMENAITDVDATYIGVRVDKAIEIIQGVGHVDFKNYPVSAKNELKSLVLEINANTQVKATLTKDGLTVKNFDGSIVIVNGPVKQTGSSESIMSIITLIAIIVLASSPYFIIREFKTSE